MIGIDTLSQSIMPAINELSNHKSWRVKITVIEEFPLLAKQLGEDFFDQKLTPILLNWLSDNVYAIRETSIKSLAKISGFYGN